MAQADVNDHIPIVITFKANVILRFIAPLVFTRATTAIDVVVSFTGVDAFAAGTTLVHVVTIF